MTIGPDIIWRDPPPDAATRIAECISAAAAASRTPTAVYFRADDIAVPGARLARLLQVFARHDAPLCLAVVPAWLTRARWRALTRIAGGHDHLWCWHQHGWRHHNHEAQGKKQEFGPARPTSAIQRDLDRGRRRLTTLMGAAFHPVFTPPWNRCSAATLAGLQQSGYRGVSRSRGSRPPCPAGLAEWPVDVDLHTTKAGDTVSGWRRLLDDLGRSLTNTRSGVMIHHQRMNQAAFEALDHLLGQLRRHPRFELTDFRRLSP